MATRPASANPGRRPARLRSGQRLARTIVFAAVAAVFAIAWLARELGLDRAELLSYAGASLSLVALVVLFGAVASTAFWLIRRWRARREARGAVTR